MSYAIIDVIYQTPVEVLSVRDMTKTTKLSNGRLVGELCCEYESKPVSAAPQNIERRKPWPNDSKTN